MPTCEPKGMPLYLGIGGDGGEKNAIQRRHSTATTMSTDPDVMEPKFRGAPPPHLQSGGEHHPVKRNAEMTFFTLITLFTRSVRLSLVHWALGVLVLPLSERCAGA